MLIPWTGSVYRPLDKAGRRVPGGTLTFYRTGTRILKDVFEDALGATTHDNPLTLDAQGGALVFLDDDESYDIVFRDPNGAQIWALPEVVGPLATAPPEINYELFGGGASGGASSVGNGGGGGGGAGGREAGTLAVTVGNTITITIGDPGAAVAAGSDLNGNAGQDSTIGAVTAVGGGRGGKRTSNGGNGGSGGGGGYANTTGGSKTVGQGNDGAGSNHAGGRGGGGGGSGSAGETGDTTGDGGDGTESPSPRAPGRRGGGGAGNGGTAVDGGGAPGQPATKAGGGGGGGDSDTAGGGAGFRGECEVWYEDHYRKPVSTTGSPTYTHVAGWHVYTFTADGSLTF